MKVFPSTYYYVKECDTVVGCTTKVASTAIGQAMANRPTISRADVMKRRRMTKDDVRVILFIREPFDRFASAYRKFCRGRTPSEFFKFTEQNENRHWQSQVWQHSEAGILIPNIVIPFENMGEMWPVFLPNIKLPVVNASKNKRSWGDIREELSPYEVGTLISRYKEDTAQWALAVQQVLDSE